MQRHQQKTHFTKSVGSHFAFHLPETQPAVDQRMNNTSQLSKNMAADSQKNSYASQHFQLQQQDSELGTDRLTSLHAKLHQEADKIRKWKVQTEMEMKHKDKKLNEATSTVESLRKSILELQLENENLSTKLQEELSCREEVLQRIKNTRDLIGALRNQEEKLEEKLASCETERTELKYLEKEHAQQFEEMAAKFRKLQQEAGADHETLFSQLQNEQQTKLTLEEELRQKTAEANSQIKILSDKIDEKDITLREVHVMLQKREEKLHSTDKDLGASQQRVNNLTEELTSRQQELEKFKIECALLQNEKEQLATELVEERERADTAKKQEDSVQEALNNSVAIFNQRQDDMQRDIDILKAELVDEQKRLKEVRAQLTESLTFSESIKSSRDVLLLEKTELELCLEKLKLELTDLQSEKYKNKAEINSLETEVESLMMHLQQEQQTAARLQVQVDEINPRYAALEREKKHFQQELHDLKQSIDAQKSKLEHTQQAHSEGSKHNQQLQETITKLQMELDSKQSELNQLQAEIKDGQNQLSAKDLEMLSVETQLRQVTADFQNMMEEHKNGNAYISELEAKFNAFGTEKTSLECQLAKLANEKASLLKEREENGDVTETERQNQTKKQEHLEQQLTEINSDLKARNKRIEDLEKELKSVRSKQNTQERKQEEKSREIDYLRQELSASEQAKEHSEKLIASLQTYLEQETHNAQEQAKQVEQLKTEMAQAQKEKTEALVQCERQIIEMTSTLEKYTSDHQKLLVQKDREIEDLHKRNNQLSAVSQQNEQRAKDGRLETQQLQQQMAALKAEMEQMEKDKSKEIDVLREQLNEQMTMVEEMKDNSLTGQPMSDTDHLMVVEGPVPTTPVAQVNALTGVNPQRSILRQSGSISKRRKVAFISPSVDMSEPCDSGSESSIELEIEHQVLAKSSAGSRTPLRLRQSPHAKGHRIVSSPLVFMPNKHSRPGTTTKKTKQSSEALQIKSPDTTKVYAMKEKEFHKMPNMRKTVMRTSKFFRSSPKERTVLKKKEEVKERLSWFDDDTLYGFGSED